MTTTHPDAVAEPDGRDALRSVLGKASLILTAFRDDDLSLSLTELTRRTGIAKATVHRLCQGLIEAELTAVGNRGTIRGRSRAPRPGAPCPPVDRPWHRVVCAGPASVRSSQEAGHDGRCTVDVVQERPCWRGWRVVHAGSVGRWSEGVRARTLRRAPRPGASSGPLDGTAQGEDPVPPGRWRRQGSQGSRRQAPGRVLPLVDGPGLIIRVCP